MRVHFTFAFLLAWVAIEFGYRHGGRGALFGALGVVLLFGCVTLHELGHSLVARRFGATVREIVLLPIGGLARMSREPSRPLHELLISLAGPFVNLVIAFGLAGVLNARVGAQLANEAYWLTEMEKLGPNALLFWLLAGNLVLAIFNLLPAFPMDGGRACARSCPWCWVGRAHHDRRRIGSCWRSRSPCWACLGEPHFGARGSVRIFRGWQERVASRAHEMLAQLSAGKCAADGADAFARKMLWETWSTTRCAAIRPCFPCSMARS